MHITDWTNMTTTDKDEQKTSAAEPTLDDMGPDRTHESQSVESGSDEFVDLEVCSAVVNGVAVYYRANSRRRLSRSTSIF